MNATTADAQKSAAIRQRIIVHTPEPGAGAGQYVAAFVKALAVSGVQTILFCPRNFAYQQEVSAMGAQIVRAPNRKINAANLWRRVLRNAEFVAAGAPKFWATVRTGDVVHFQFAMHLGLGLPFLAIARMKGASTVLTVHDPVPHRWILPRPFRFIEKALINIEYSLCSRLIVHNQAGKQILTDHSHLCSSVITVIPHGPLNPIPAGGVDSKASSRVEPLRLLAFGSLRENKGLDVAIAAVQRVRQSSIDRPIVLTIAGTLPNAGEREYWKRCLRIIAAEPAGIEVLERPFDDDEVGLLFARHDAVLLPYGDFHSESGVAMLALSQARPIIATPAGGLRELLDEVDCGILIESPTVNAVMAAIQKAVFLPPVVLRSKGWNGYRHVLSHRCWTSIAQRTRILYHSLACAPLETAEPKVVLHTPEPGSSAALYVNALSAALTAEKLPIRVVCPANHRARQAMERNPMIDIRVCGERATDTHVSLAVKLTQNLRFIISSCKTLLAATNPGDIAHFQYILHLPFGLIFLICAKVKRAHIVFTVHDPVPHKFLFPRILRGLEVRTLALAYKWSDALIVHSEAGKRKLVDAFAVSATRIRVIVHGPYELKEKVRVRPESNCLELLFFGSLRENKGPHLAIEAVQRLAAEGLAVRLTIAGEVVNRKEQKYWQHCRTLIDTASGAVRLVEGFVCDEELPELFSQCDCFVLPYTTFSSDSGVAYMALANAKPIVSTDAGGLGWLLDNCGGGVRIPEASVAGVISALREVINLGPKTLERMGQEAAVWMSAECGWSKVARETHVLYAELVPEISGARLWTPSVEEAVELVGAGRE